MANGNIKITFQFPADQIHDRMIKSAEKQLDETIYETCAPFDSEQRKVINAIFSDAILEVLSKLTNVDMVEA